MSAGSVTLGGNLSVAVGPLGRNAEGVRRRPQCTDSRQREPQTGSLNTKGKVAAMYSYSRTKGLFGGVSIEGSIIVERQDANAKAYGQDVTAKQLRTLPLWSQRALLMAAQSLAPSIPHLLLTSSSMRSSRGQEVRLIRHGLTMRHRRQTRNATEAIASARPTLLKATRRQPGRDDTTSSTRLSEPRRTSGIHLRIGLRRPGEIETGTRRTIIIRGRR